MPFTASKLPFALITILMQLMAIVGLIKGLLLLLLMDMKRKKNAVKIDKKKKLQKKSLLIFLLSV